MVKFISTCSITVWCNFIDKECFTRLCLFAGKKYHAAIYQSRKLRGMVFYRQFLNYFLQFSSLRINSDIPNTQMVLKTCTLKMILATAN